MISRAFVATALAVASLSAPIRVGAQQTDVIRGRVSSTAAGNDAVANASVVATSASRGVNRTAKTDRDGRYTITFPGGEGDYFLSITAIGYTPKRFELRRSADEDILIGDVQLSPASAALDTVVTVGKRARPTSDKGSPDVGGGDRPVNMGLVPAEQLGSLASMAASVPGVLFVQGVNGDPSGYSLLGLDGSQNGLSLNGMNSGATDLPRDADVAVTLSMSPYDVSQGQFSGGRLNIRLPSGSNYDTRTSSLRLNAPPLEWTDAAGRALGQRYTDANLGGAFGGPISLDQAFYNFSYQLGRRGNDLETLLNTNPLGLETEGVSADSVTRLQNLLRGAGVPPTVARFPSHRLADQGLVLGSIDYTPLSSASGQAFNLTFNGSWNRVTPAAPVATAFPSSAFDLTAWNGSVQLHHSALFGFGILSESGASLNSVRRFTTPYIALPSGSVLVGSSFVDRPSGVQSIAFGGTPTAMSATTQSVDLTNQLSWFSLNNKHRLKLTSELHADAIASTQSTDGGGAFAFNSLADVENGRPASFVRQLAAAKTHEHELIGGFSLGDSYRATPALQIVYGARLDADRFLDRPAANPDLAAQLGAHNDRLPVGIYASPRVGFSWTYGAIPQIAAFEGAARPPRAVLSGGIGDFRNALGVGQPAQALGTTGLPGGVQQLTCVGSAAPAPDWAAYAADRASVPSVCADGTTGTVFANAVPNVTLFAPGYAAQHSLRSNLKWVGAVLDNRFVAAVNGTYSLNLNQSGFVDLNLDPTPRFTLADEGGRPVFVDATSIVPATGAIAAHDGRRSPLFNHVTELRSDLSSVSRQLTVQLSPLASSTRYTWGVSYTLNSVRDRANGFASTAGNPFAIDAARSAFDWRHQILFDVGYNAFDAVRLFWVQSFFSGVPFTPSVGGDVNGDGYALNDRAFVFDPARTADSTLAASMRSLLAGAPRGVRDCLGRQLDHLAARSSCEGPWSSAASLRIDFNPVKIRMPQRTSISFSVANPLAAADVLLHGESGLHGWGQGAVPDNRLLFVRGFDPQAQRFTYQVNQRFGSTAQAVSAARNPVTLTALVRVDVGPTREKQTLTRTLDQGRTKPGVKMTAPDIKGSFGTAGLINPMAAMLRASDMLHLTGKQADSLATMNRWYVVRLDSIWAPLAKRYASLPESYDHAQAYGWYTHARGGSVDLLMRVVPSIRTLLTPEQIRKLPDLVRSYLDPRYLAAVRSGTQGLSGPVFPTGVGVPSTGGAGRGRGGGPGGG